jgi:1,4-dihydroxy-2-naphthoyl-CoA synthase
MHFSQLLECAQSIRNCGKPVIAAVNGRAIGSGNQLQLLCDLAIASDKAVFGQHGTKRSGAPLFWGTTLMSMFVGERKAREIIFLSREYSAQEALDMGLVNKVVPHDQLYTEVKQWCDEILQLSPTSLRILKTSMNFKSDMLYPALFHAREMLDLFSDAPERMEGTKAWVEGTKPDFNQFRKRLD